MKHHLADFRIVLTALTALFFAGSMACVQELGPTSEEPTVDEINQTLMEVANRPSIDLTIDEAASFGNAGFEAAYGSNVAEAPDDTLPEPERRATHRIMALWGQIRPQDDTQADRLVWNPSLYVQSQDVIRVKRTLYFEDTDAIIPVDCLNCVVIESTTGRHVDGVIVDLYLQDSSDRLAFFEFTSPLVSVRYSADELADLNEVIFVDRAGNGLMLMALPLVEQQAQRGILSGDWATVDSTDECSGDEDCWWVQGYFGGRWMSEDGELMGHLAGRFGHGIFFGKYIDTDGQFQGHLLGEYADGHFHGEWFNEAGNQVGVLHGRYTSEESGETGRFEGVWARLGITDPIECTNPDSDGNCSDDPDEDCPNRRDDGTCPDSNEDCTNPRDDGTCPDSNEDCTNPRDDGTCPDSNEDCTNPYDDGTCPDSTEDRPDSDGDTTDDDRTSEDDDRTNSDGDRPDSGHSDDDPAGTSTDGESSDDPSSDEDGTASTDGA